MARKRLILIDGYSLIFRAFYGTRFLSTSDGRPTNALFGFVSMLFQLIEREKPECVVVALDPPGGSFRSEEYSDYKAHRTEAPAELIAQFPMSRDLIDAFGIPVIEIPGYEADDVIGTLSLDAKQHGYDTTIVTGDLDSLQLVDDAVAVMTTRKGVSDVVIYDIAGVRERYGFGPEYVPDYKALVGDPSDNIPGVKGVGAKTAEKLINQFGHVENIIAHLDDLDPKFRDKVEPFIDQIPKSKKLATIVRDVPLKFDYKPYSLSPRQLESAKAMLQSLEFRSHLKRLPEVFKPYTQNAQMSLLMDEPSLVKRDELKTTAITTYQALASWAGLDSISLYPSTDRYFVSNGEAVAHTQSEVALDWFAMNPSKSIVHDAKWFHKETSCYEAAGFDTMLASYVLQSSRSSYQFGDIAQGFLDDGMPETDAERALALYRLVEPLSERLKLEEQWPVFADIELPLAPVLAKMEALGVLVDTGMLAKYSEQLAQTITDTQAKIYEAAGEEFNIGSPQQLGQILFEKLALPAGKKTKTGHSTSADTLAPLAAENPIVLLVMNWRELTKLKSTYVDALPKLIAEDGRIHTSFNQTVAATGRLSSNDPNLQNIPVRTELGREIRRAFIAPKGYNLASLDYSQIELRILAHMCEDEKLVEAFSKGLDVHAATASLMWNEPIGEISSEHRRYAKMLNFAVLYGVTDFGLANQLGGEFTVAEAKQLISDYYLRFPKVKAFTDSIVEEARSKGFTRTLCGRRRYFSDIHAGNRQARFYAERQAMNAPLQGTAADMIKIAMIKMPNVLENSASKMILQVHDELLFEVDLNEIDLLRAARKTMETALPLNVPVVVDVSIGENWLEMTEIA